MTYAPLSAERLSDVWPALSAPFTDPRAIQKTELRVDFASLGINYQCLADRLNSVLGPAHWRLFEEEKTVQELPTGAFAATAKIRVEFGNPHFLPDTGLNAWEVVAMRFGYGKHLAVDYGEAIQGAVTNGFKKAVGLLGPGHEAYAGTLTDPSDLPTPSVAPQGRFSARVHHGKFQNGRFDGQIQVVETDVILPITATGPQAMQLQAHWHAQTVCQMAVTASTEGAAYSVVELIPADGAAVPSDTPAAADPSLTSEPALPPIALDAERLTAAETQAAHAAIDWARVRTGYVTDDDQFPTTDAATDYLDTLQVLTTARKQLGKLAAKIQTMTQFQKLVRMADRLGTGEAAAMDCLVQQAPDVPVPNLSAKHYQAAAHTVLQNLLESVTHAPAQAN